MEETNPYPSATFKPPLSSTVTVVAPSTRIPEPRLRWQATLEQKVYDELCNTGGELQVWSNCSGQEWSATPFHTTINYPNEDMERLELSLTTAVNNILLEASVPLHPLMSHDVEFTYRVVHASQPGYASIHWLGTMDTNGRFVFVTKTDGHRSSVENWIDGGNGIWTSVVREPLVVAELRNVKCSGWVFTKDSTTGSFDISRFSDVASFKSVTGLIVVFALLPKTNPDTCVVFSPVLYTSRDGTFSLDDGNVLLYPGDGETTLAAYTSLSTWKDHVPHGAVPLETQTPDFIAVPFRSKFNVGHLHLLPVTGARVTITLSSSDIALFAPSSSIVLFDSNRRVIKSFLTLTQTEYLRLAVGSVGEMITAVPAYAVSATISVAFLLCDPGNTAEPLAFETKPEVQSRQSPSSSQALDHSALSRILSLVASVFQYIWNLLLSTICSKPSTKGITRIQSRVEDATSSPRLLFNVTGNPPLLVMGEDASKLLVLASGKPLRTAPKTIGEGLWLVDFANELPTSDGAARRMEILLQE